MRHLSSVAIYLVSLRQEAATFDFHVILLVFFLYLTSCPLCLFPTAATTNDHKLCELKQENKGSGG